MRREAILEDFIKGKRIIYLAYKLFNFSDKLDAMWLEKAIVKGVKDAFDQLGEELNFYPVFFPYRDTLQHSDVGAVTWEDVFRGDKNRLKNLFACIGLLDGPSFDDGIGVELGYAVAFNLPTLGVINDSLLYHHAINEELTHLVDPLVDSYIGRLIENIQLHGKIFTPDLFEGLDLEKEAPKLIRSFNFTNTLRKRFSKRIEELIEEAYDSIRFTVKDLVLHPENYIRLDNEKYKPKEKRIHLEFNGGKYQWQRELSEIVKDELNKKGYEVTISKRFNSNIGKNTTIRSLAEKDLINALESEIIIVNGDEANVPIGSAFLIGLCKGRRQKVILYYSGNEYWSEPPSLGPIIRNPMVKYSADVIVRDYRQISNAVKTLLGE